MARKKTEETEGIKYPFKASYEEWLREFTDRIYRKRIKEFIKFSIASKYSWREARELEELLEKETIKIVNINNFFSNRNPAADIDNFYFYAYSKNLEEYFLNTIYNIKIMDSLDAMEIVFTKFFMNIAIILDKYNEENISIDYLYELLKQVVVSCISFRFGTKIAFRCLDDKLTEIFAKRYGFNPDTYKAVCQMFKYAIFSSTLSRFGRKALYIVMIKFITPVLLFILLLGSFGIFS